VAARLALAEALARERGIEIPPVDDSEFAPTAFVCDGAELTAPKMRLPLRAQ
jgi:hypothetical protein